MFTSFPQKNTRQSRNVKELSKSSELRQIANIESGRKP